MPLTKQAKAQPARTHASNAGPALRPVTTPLPLGAQLQYAAKHGQGPVRLQQQAWRWRSRYYRSRP